MIEVGAHLDVGESVEFEFLQRLPMKALEEAGVLMLHGGEKFMAADGVGGGDCLVDEARSNRSETGVTRLLVAHRDGGTEAADAAELGSDPEATAVPEAGFAFVNADDADDRVFHAGDNRFADDGDHVVVDFVAVVLVEDSLFFAKDAATEGVEVFEIGCGGGDFEDEVLRLEVLEAFDNHGLTECGFEVFGRRETGSEMVDDEMGVFGDAEEATGTPSVLPREAEKVETTEGGDSPLVGGVTVGLESIEFEKAKVGLEADAPENGGNVVVAEVEGGGFVFRGPAGLVRGGGGRFDALLIDVLVDALADAEVGFVSGIKFGGGIGSDGESFLADSLDVAVELHSFGGEFAEVDFVATIATGEVVVGIAGFVGIGLVVDTDFVVAHFFQPGDGVFSAIEAGGTGGVAEAEVDLAAFDMEFFCQLTTGLAGANDDHFAGGDVVGVVVVGRENLFDVGGDVFSSFGGEGSVVGTGGADDGVGGPASCGSGDEVLLALRLHGKNGDVFPQGWLHFVEVALEPSDDFLFDHEALGVVAVVVVAGEVALMIGGDEAEAIPTLVLPTVNGFVFFEDEMLDSLLGKVVGGGEACWPPPIMMQGRWGRSGIVRWRGF